ncbi:hypothetical protein U1839_24590 [Sphingomonas sp. RT2P30]|uniref:hypothetical protein n=1 Tax=Parasphingomonas halimpatiens TaxID=3096162 RepID=UPI002FCAA272
MLRKNSLRVLVADDVGLIATYVAARIRRAASQSALPGCGIDFIEDIELRGGGRGTNAVKRLESAIFKHDINTLVLDRGIAETIDGGRVNPSDVPSTAYYRSRQVNYDCIEDILVALSASARRRIEIILVYTLDDLEVESPWYVDTAAMRAKLSTHFPRNPHFDVIKTNTEIYREAGLQLFNPDPSDSTRFIARGPDLLLYGAIVGEMAWRHISGSVLRAEGARRMRLRSWLVRNYFIFALITFGLGVGINAGYDFLKASVMPGGLAIVCAIVGLVVPFLLLRSNPRLLMLPNIEDDE